MLNDKQKEIVTGSLLGDGTIWTNFVDPLMKLQITQSKFDHVKVDKKQYMLWFISEMIDLGCSIRLTKVNGTGLTAGKKYDRYTFATKGSLLWVDLEKKWYVERTDHSWWKRRKIVPQDLKLTPLTLCVWHMDDGSNNPKDANVELNTQGFTVEEVDFLIDRLGEDLGIQSHKKKTKKDGQYKIYIGRQSYFDYMEIIKPHIKWDCFKYKTDTSKYTKKPHRGEAHSHSKLTDKKVKEIFSLRDEGWLQKRIAKKIKVSPTAVSLVLSGDRWQHLGMKRDTPKKSRLSKEKKAEIIALSEQGMLQKEIAERLNTTQSTVSRILGKNEKHMVIEKGHKIVA